MKDYLANSLRTALVVAAMIAAMASWTFPASPVTSRSAEAKEDSAVTAARKRLEIDPSDPNANLAVGRFLCFEKGDWAAGISMLARGPDVALAKLAAEDASAPDVAISWIVLGHDWWDYAAAQQGSAKVRCQERAAFWYLMSLAATPSDDRPELRKRIVDTDAEAQAFYDAAGTARPVDRPVIALKRRLLQGGPTAAVPTDALTKDTQFAPDGDKSFHIDGTLTVKADEAVNLTFAAGFELRGGTIDLGRHGKAHLKGTADKPVIFRDVTVSQDLGASLDAENAVFDNCHFNKGGAWYSLHSSKWRFSDCVLHSCSFARLSEVDYGFQFRRCALISMDLPEITHKQREGFDHMNVLRGEWNKIDSCEFADCSIPPTVAWCGENCNFRACRFAPGEAFDSEKDLEWKAHVEDTVGDSPPTAWDQHPAIRGVVTHVEPGQPFDATHFTGVSQIPEARFEKGMVRVLVPQLRAPI